MKRQSISRVVFILIAGVMLASAGCAAPPAVTPASETASPAGGQNQLVPFDQLIANPDQFDGQPICTEGVSVDAFEAIALGASTYERNGAVFLTEPAIWIATASREVIGDCQEFDAGGGVKFCQERVCGVFHAGGEFGHTGAYQYELAGE